MYIKKRGKKKLANEAAVEEGQSSKPKSLLESDDFNPRLGDYQLMEAIGKGGYGVVYRGLNIVSGVTVAVKRISLHNIPPDALDGILMEIKLLENLSHPNIVRYCDSERTDGYLNIILEFVENGALSSLLNKFGGAFPESLVAHYIAQTLMGLNYLHTQGVIHRDIKGANILSTKEGLVKLADFGVATKLNESRKSDSVVGTPYWMAPEIIEMTGQQSSACDIWSVGCTAIELLTGKPPYFDLQQMPALFRIVQDEHPPLPDGISPACQDFLLQTFQKDPNRRIDAQGLLKHPWLKAAVAQEQNRATAAPSFIDQSINQPTIQSAAPIVKSPSEQKLQVSTVPLNHSRSSKARKLAAWAEDDEDEDWDAEINGELADHSPQPRPPILANLSSAQDVDMDFDPDADPFADLSDDDAPFARPTTSNASNTRSSAPVSHPHTRKTQDWSAFVEKDEDDVDDDDFGDLDDLDLGAKLRDPVLKPGAANAAADIDEADLDLDLDAFDEFDSSAQKVDDELTQLNKQLARLISGLDLSQTETTIVETLEKFEDFHRRFPQPTIHYLNANAVIPMMELLTSDNANIIQLTLHFINSIISLNQQFQQSLALVGLIPAIIRLALNQSNTQLSSSKQPNKQSSNPSNNQPNSISTNNFIRLEAANFIRQLCYQSDYTRKIFIACDGLPVLVHFLQQEEYDRSPILILNTIDCIKHVFEIQTQPKNDFCRLFCKFHLLPSLARHLLALLEANQTDMEKQQTTGQATNQKQIDNRCEYITKIIQILLMFSQGDSVVKKSMAQPSVMTQILDSLQSISYQNQLFTLLSTKAPNQPADRFKSEILSLLKCLCNLSMDSSTLDMLELSGIISQLMPFIQKNQPLEIQHQALLIFFYLTQLKVSRQEEAAKQNLMVHLMRFITQNSPMKQFAFPIFFTLMRNAYGRMQARKFGGLDLLMSSLSDLYWCTHALDVLAAWLTDDPARIGCFIFSSTAHFQALLRLFQSAGNMNEIQYEKLLPLFRRLLTGNLTLNRAFGMHPMFIEAIKAHLQSHSKNNAIRVNLLNILGLIIVSHDTRHASAWTQDTELQTVLSKLASEKASVIVASLARKTLDRIEAEAKLAQQPKIM